MNVLLMIVKYKILTDYKPCIKAVLAKGDSFYCMVLQYIVETAKYKPHWSILKENPDLTIKLFTWKYGFIVKLRFLRSRTNSCRKNSIKAFSTFEQSVVSNMEILKNNSWRMTKWLPLT